MIDQEEVGSVGGNGVQDRRLALRLDHLEAGGKVPGNILFGTNLDDGRESPHFQTCRHRPGTGHGRAGQQHPGKRRFTLHKVLDDGQIPPQMAKAEGVMRIEEYSSRRSPMLCGEPLAQGNCGYRLPRCYESPGGGRRITGKQRILPDFPARVALAGGHVIRRLHNRQAAVSLRSPLYEGFHHRPPERRDWRKELSKVFRIVAAETCSAEDSVCGNKPFGRR
jgi:hypothetical protein